MAKIETKNGREKKWREAFKKFSSWDTERQREVQLIEAETIAEWLLALKLPRYDILEIGCGNGHLGKVLVEKLILVDIDFTYHFTDLLPECLAKARETMSVLNTEDKISFSTLDVLEIDEVLSPESQQIIVSTGFVSAVTYRAAVPKVAQVLKRDGVLICDFINHFSPLVFFSHPISSVKKLIRTMYLYATRTEVQERYHFGMLGLRPYFKKNQLELSRHKSIRFRQNPIICMFRKR